MLGNINELTLQERKDALAISGAADFDAVRITLSDDFQHIYAEILLRLTDFSIEGALRFLLR